MLTMSKHFLCNPITNNVNRKQLNKSVNKAPEENETVTNLTIKFVRQN